MLRIDVLTLFPEIFPPVIGSSIVGRAQASGLLAVHLHDIRDYTLDRHGKVDDRPFGGGPGMVIACQPLWDCVSAVERMDAAPPLRILLTPQGRRLTQTLVEQLAAMPRLLLVAGHYEGIDERVIEKLAPLEISIGDYCLSGGELPALVLIDALARLQPGVLGHEDSASEDSFSIRTPAGTPLLDCPHYTRPREWMGHEVPEVLLSGDHAAIARWRDEQRKARTAERRPDLLPSPPPDPRDPPVRPSG